MTSAPGVEQRDASAKMELFYAELTRIVSEEPHGIAAIYVPFGLRFTLAHSLSLSLSLSSCNIPWSRYSRVHRE